VATRKFNIDEVVAGAKIVQRSGKSAKFVSYAPEAEEETVVWLDHTGTLQLVYDTGSYYSSGGLKEGEESEMDLFILEPDPPTPKKVIQCKEGTKVVEGKSFDFWYDTLWEDVKYAREQFPNEIYREVLVTG
jgi:TATA-box binding protein (TBP) (component of TFIID and TFIIIB)